MGISIKPRSTMPAAIAAAVFALLTGYFGMSAKGYFAPAAMLAIVALLLWKRFGRFFVRGVMIANVASALVLVLTLAFGSPLGDLKLDIAGVALLANLLTGGPLMALVAPLLARWNSKAETVAAGAV